MSSPPCKPENAAPDAPVSSSARPAGGVVVLAAEVPAAASASPTVATTATAAAAAAATAAVPTPADAGAGAGTAATSNPTLPNSDATPTASVGVGEPTGPVQEVPLPPPVPATITTTTPTPPPPPLTTTAPAAAHQAHASPPVPSSPQTPLPRVPLENHADQNKYPKAPALPQRSHGASLLTQALATARGIVPPTSGEQPQKVATSANSANPSSQSHPSSLSHQNAIPIRSQPRLDRRQSHPEPQLATNDPRDGTLYQGDGDSLTPRGSFRVSSTAPPVALAVTTTTLPPSSSPMSAATYNVNMVEYRDVTNSVLGGHHDLVFSKSKERGTPGDLADTEGWAQERNNRSVPASPGTRNTNGPLSPRFPETLFAVDDANGDRVEGQTQSKSLKTDHRVSLGPSQAWSIGTADLGNDQDGKVEKSITEVLSGKEPNARSRKASHSLRFFKEGLPEDTSKKREPRSGSHLREKFSSPVKEGVPHAGQDQDERAASEPRSSIPTDDKTPPADRPVHSRPFPTPSPEADPISESPEDYFFVPHQEKGADKGRDVPAGHISKADIVLSGLEHGRPRTPPSDQGSDRRKSDDATEVGESAEDADDSGEEKISSAVFLPHQGPEESPDLVPVSVAGGPPRLTPSSRTLSRAEDFHTWLVKADQPEADEEEDAIEKLKLDDKRPVAASADVTTLPSDEFAVADDAEIFSPKAAIPAPQQYEEHVHEHQWVPKQPLDAIELIPYKHQVGGHTTLWRFSKRAVCKQLNNRENEFYEKIEKYHRDLLAFLPRYIGVLNVTFQKQPRRKSTIKRDDVVTQESRPAGRDELGILQAPSRKPSQESVTSKSQDTNKLDGGSRTRVISQSLQSIAIPVPTVNFVDNQHILPRNLLQPSQNGAALPGRLRSSSASVPDLPLPRRANGSKPLRPTLEDRHANSWGATTVNKKLRNEVFNDAFLKRGPIMIHRHWKGHQRPLPRLALQQSLRLNANAGSVTPPDTEDTVSDGPGQPTMRRTLLQSQSDIAHLSLPDEEPDVKDVTGTSAPEADRIGESLPQRPRKRRHSGNALRRKPLDVRESRGDLQLFEEADDQGYGGDSEDSGKRLLPNSWSHETRMAGDDIFADHDAEAMEDDQMALSTITSAATSGPPSPTAEFNKIPRPINPKEAQTQRDSRVEYFLLLEDLTAGMKRPCIMDLKMGTRQHGVDASAKKQKSQKGKCAKTTSRELGVRVCGLQVWDVGAQSYVFRDKYYGRDIKAGHEFQEALTRFLYDGVDQSSILRHIPTVLQKLSQLEVIIRRLDGYRFYAASLLMFYDGEPSQAEYDTALEDSTTDFATDTEEPTRTPRKNKRDIDFKMADFANCITPGDRINERLCPPAHPDEPDRGFLRGLHSLRQYFLMIQRDTRAELGLVSQMRNGASRETLDIEMTQDEGEVSE